MSNLEIDRLCDEFESAWQAGRSPRVEDFLLRIDEEDREKLLAEIIPLDLTYHRQRAIAIRAEDYSVLGEQAVAIARREIGLATKEEPFIDIAGVSGQAGLETSRMRSATQETVDSSGQRNRASSAFKNTPLEPGKKLGRYEILRQLGQGGMGAVYLARDPTLDRNVAIKIPFHTPDCAEQILLRFQREARAVAALHHPNICPVYEVTEADGIHFMVMAYIEGSPLSETLREIKRMKVADAVELTRKLALTLDEAHRKGIVHRDLKPSNIMIDARHEPIIMDFGLARLDRVDIANLTEIGQMIGTPAYMPPEQVGGDIDATGPASDIYSLGVILYQMLTGRLPLEGSMMSLMFKIANETPEPVSTQREGIPPWLDAVCAKAMAKQPSQRFSSMREMADAMQGHAPRSQLLALMFTDLVDSSALKLRLGDSDYVRYIAEPHDAIFRRVIDQFEDAEVNNFTGDGFFATFERVSDAVKAALIFHHELHTYPWENVKPKTRIGIHLGEALFYASSQSEKPQIASHAADMCARVMGMGSGGQTLITRLVFENARAYLGDELTIEGSDTPMSLRWQAHGRYKFKGRDEGMEIFEVGVPGIAPLRQPTGGDKAERERDQFPKPKPVSTRSKFNRKHVFSAGCVAILLLSSPFWFGGKKPAEQRTVKPNTTIGTADPQPRSKLDEPNIARDVEKAQLPTEPEMAASTSTLPSASVSSLMPIESRKLAAKYTVELSSLKCVQQINPDRADQVTIEIRVDGNLVDKIEYPHNYQGVPCVRMQKDETWPINLQLTFEKDVVLVFCEIDGYMRQTVGVATLSAATLRQRLFKVKIDGGNTFFPHEYELTWNEVASGPSLPKPESLSSMPPATTIAAIPDIHMVERFSLTCKEINNVGDVDNIVLDIDVDGRPFDSITYKRQLKWCSLSQHASQ